MSLDREEGKALVASTAFWGTVVMLIGFFVPEVKEYATEEWLTRLANTGSTILTLGGAAVALYGRITAKRPITAIVKVPSLKQ